MTERIVVTYYCKLEQIDMVIGIVLPFVLWFGFVAKLVGNLYFVPVLMLLALGLWFFNYHPITSLITKLKSNNQDSKGLRS